MNTAAVWFIWTKSQFRKDLTPIILPLKLDFLRSLPGIIFWLSCFIRTCRHLYLITSSLYFIYIYIYIYIYKEREFLVQHWHNCFTSCLNFWDEESFENGSSSQKFRQDVKQLYVTDETYFFSFSNLHFYIPPIPFSIMVIIVGNGISSPN